MNIFKKKLHKFILSHFPPLNFAERESTIWSVAEQPYQLVQEGDFSTAQTLEAWDKLEKDGKIHSVKSFDKGRGFSVWKEEGGNHYRVNYQPQKERTVFTREPKQTFANAVLLKPEELADILR